MKNLLLTLVICFSINKTITAQVVTTDPGSYAYYAQLAVNGIQSISIATEKLEHVKKAADKLQKVSSAVKQGELAYAIVNNLKECAEIIKSYDRALEKVRSEKKKRKLRIHIGSAIKDLEVLSTIQNEVLKDGFFEMGDSERITLLLNVYDRSKESLKELQLLSSTIRRSQPF